MRCKYFDIAKGLLIIFVIIHHIPAVATSLNQSDAVLEYVDSVDFLYRGFFMPAFFFITGCCSNFRKDFKPFIISNAKGLLIPAITIGLFCQVIQMIYPPHDFYVNIKSWIYCGGAFWFLPALFLSKLIMWSINKFLDYSYLLKTFVLLVLGLFTSVLATEHFKFNPWYLQQAILLTPFLYIGTIFKSRQFTKSQFLIIGGGNLIVICLLRAFDYIFPTVTMVLTLDVTNYLNYLLLGVLGSFFVVGLCQLINASRILEFIGKSTVIIYTLHIEIIRLVFVITKDICTRANIITQIVHFVGVLAFTIFLTSLLAYLLNKPYIKVLIGKF